MFLAEEGGGGGGLEQVDEKELSEEGRKITVLQESLHQTTQLCHEMIKHLDQFETRVAALEPTIMPLHRNLSIISRMHQSIPGCESCPLSVDVESTLNVLKLLSEKNELAKREEFILAGG